MVNGFLDYPEVRVQNIRVAEEAGGWQDVLSHFRLNHLREMRRFENQFMVLLLDFDGKRERLDKVKGEIPSDLRDRVFVLGTLTEPEKLIKGQLSPVF